MGALVVPDRRGRSYSGNPAVCVDGQGTFRAGRRSGRPATSHAIPPTTGSRMMTNTQVVLDRFRGTSVWMQSIRQ